MKKLFSMVCLSILGFFGGMGVAVVNAFSKTNFEDNPIVEQLSLNQEQSLELRVNSLEEQVSWLWDYANSISQNVLDNANNMMTMDKFDITCEQESTFIEDGNIFNITDTYKYTIKHTEYNGLSETNFYLDWTEFDYGEIIYDNRLDIQRKGLDFNEEVMVDILKERLASDYAVVTCFY